ncbi:MAG: alpha/beta hydrolase [Granulosicoccus sp.]|nr:alpha/beta hydrolase [Granulosicoccus sp.]
MKVLFYCLLPCLLVAGLALYGNSASRWIAAEFPPIGDFVEFDGLKMHFLDSGQSESGKSTKTIVLLHGASTSLMDFQTNLIADLSESYRVIAIDRPGLGYSERGDTWLNPSEQAQRIQSTLRSLGIENAVWIGHSWAGSVVLAGMLEYPQQVTAGVLLAGATHPWDTGVSWHVAITNQPLIGRLFAELVVPVAGAAALESAVNTVFTPEKVPENYVDETGVKLSLRPQTFRNNAADIYHLSDWLKTQTPRYDTLKQPLLMITGTADTVVPSWNHAERIAKQVPGAQWQRIDGAGHALHHSQTNTVVMHIKQFLVNQ